MRIWKSAVVVLVAALVAPADGAAQSTGYTAEALTLSRAPGGLAGTLLLPQAAGPVPIVLLIAGSPVGPERRLRAAFGVWAPPAGRVLRPRPRVGATRALGGVLRLSGAEGTTSGRIVET